MSLNNVNPLQIRYFQAISLNNVNHLQMRIHQIDGTSDYYVT